MNERKEPTISGYAPPKDESPRQPSAGGNRAGRPTAPPRSSAHSPAAKPIVVKSKVAPFAFMLALTALGLAGFMYWQLLETQKLLMAADVRIKDLEGKFELSDDEANASTETIQAKLKWADSEIRKLWGVSHDKNRKAIAANKDSIASVKKTADAAKRAVSSEIKKATQGIEAEVKLVSDLVDAQQSSLSDIEAKNLSLTQQSQSVSDKLNGLESDKNALERRIKTNEQAIEAIDAFRRSVNQQLLQLKGGA